MARSVDHPWHMLNEVQKVNFNYGTKNCIVHMVRVRMGMGTQVKKILLCTVSPNNISGLIIVKSAAMLHKGVV